MKKAILGKKLGMTQYFLPDGRAVPVTVVQAGPCVVIQKKTVERDGYDALKVGFMAAKEKQLNKPQKGQFEKAGASLHRHVREFKLADATSLDVGESIKVDVFSDGDIIDVSGISKGYGFSGVIYRWNQHRGPMKHGSKFHRGVGSMGANSSPSRVFKNKHMPGQYGVEKVTIQNLEIVRVDAERNLMLIKGSVPGAKGAVVFIRDAIKA